MAATDSGDSSNGEMVLSDSEGGPQGITGQVAEHVNQVLHSSFSLPWNTKTKLEQGRLPHESLADQMLGDSYMTDFEDFDPKKDIGI